ncbi:gephyrin-like molybdotransferase Glp [uncultured Dokdonia sp.]|uniref:molybdopterin molybdotransferase MoeA n=1 Tax=uncultured Dokdonia sp. TaxID=575653 RepID=UPI0026065BCD|nr:gephyrin-like molybdotransferase Glp [uncultured Dokdonia sp.]
MITVNQALQYVWKQPLPSVKEQSLQVEDALGQILAQDINSPISLPSFKQSSMDGYAVRFREKENTLYNLIGEIKAGDSANLRMQPGEAVRIFTGAPVPQHADAVVIQEKSMVLGTQLTIQDTPTNGQNIRPIGSQIEKGKIALTKGHYITPASIGLLKSLGIEKLQVFQPPKVAIVITGNELVSTGKPLEEGQIYESNSAVLKAALYQQGIDDVSIVYAKDTLEETETVLNTVLSHSDMVLISGGISVGDYDFVGKALKNLEVEELFYKVLQKPGKPLFFGKKENTFVFALPGNPASTLTCFYVYVTLLLDRWRGSENPGLLRVQLPISKTFENTFGRALFLKARIKNNKVEMLDQQNSATVISFAKANALLYISEDTQKVAENELVETLILPYGSSN